MKNFLSIIFFIGIINASYAQDKKVYWTGGGEMIFSFVDANDGQQDWGSIIRFSPVLNIQTIANYDVSEKFGLFSGINIRNVGFIADTEPGVRMKYRTYNAGIPIAIKVGNLDGLMVFGGYEFEFPFVYKEKRFENEKKVDVTTIWFSKRNSSTMHSLFAGVQFPYGTTLKFKYYLSNFFNQDYRAVDENGQTVTPFANYQANIFYISLSFHLFYNDEFYYNSF